MKTAVIIPTHNEAASIHGLIRKVNDLHLHVIVIDDGSTDDTFRIASQNHAVVLRNERNMGKGAALIKGFEYALSKDYDAVLTMDGDGQHLPEDIPTFLTAAQSRKYDLIIGNRMARVANMPMIRIMTNKYMSWIISGITKQKIPDSQCGFRLIRKEVLQNIKLRTSNFELESEMLIEASRAGFSIMSVPIQTVYNDQPSHIHPVRDTIRFFKYLFERTKSIKPLRKRA
jgi:glycosyltransferase involved in cell wall biosynthesis